MAAARTGSEDASSTVSRELPSTQRGLRTRRALIDAARTVFERSGYLDSRLIDITVEAQCSAGTFYTYFASKEEIFAAVMELAREDMMHPGMPHTPKGADPAEVIAASNRAYLEAYRRNAKLMGLLEQVASIDPEFRVLRLERADAFVRRNARSIEKLQKAGLADANLDPLLTSRALSGMISRLAFGYFVSRGGEDRRRRSDLRRSARHRQPVVDQHFAILATPKLMLTPGSCLVSDGAMTPTRTAVLVDFGGVLTSSVLRAFEDFGASLGGDPRLPLTLLSRDDVSKRLLSDHESGKIDQEAFEAGFGERLRAHGAVVDSEGLVDRMQAGLGPRRRDGATDCGRPSGGVTLLRSCPMLSGVIATRVLCSRTSPTKW